MSPGQGDLQYFELGAFPLASGFVLPAARLGYRCLGTLSPDHSNAVLLPHMYSGTSEFMTGFIGRGRPLDPERYFFILPDQFANGVSSSPSNTSAPFERAAFPPVAISDDVRAQRRLLEEGLGIDRLMLVSGWSMGGQQTLEWAVRYPEMVGRAVSFAATLANPDHTKVFCDLHMEALRSDPAFAGGYYRQSSDVHVGLRRHAQAFALMGVTAAMYRNQGWRPLGFESFEGFVRGFVQAYFLGMDPNDLLAQAAKWRDADVSGSCGGDLDAAVGRITAATTMVAFEGDLFFPPEDVEAAARRIPGASYERIGSVWGHFTMFNLSPDDTSQIDEVFAVALAER